MNVPLIECTEYSNPSEFKKLDFIFRSLRKYLKGNPIHMDILEIGCGKGNISLPLASIGYNIVGLDINKKTIKYLTRKNNFENATFFVGDAENVALHHKFDAVICSEVFEHLPNPERLSESLNRFVKPGGIIIVTIPNGYGPWELLYDLPLRFALTFHHKNNHNQKGAGHIQNYTLDLFRKILLNQGIYIKEIHHSDFISGLPLIKTTRLAQYDVKIADKLPYWLASGWYFVCGTHTKL